MQAVAAGTRRIRAWRPTPAEARLADLAETLAGRELDCPVPIRRQLVHGDFWDDNVRFRRRQVALVTDFDFLGGRPRTDDLALTLYHTSIDIADVTSDPVQLAELVGAYEAGLGTRLSQDESCHPARHGAAAAVVHRGLGGPAGQPRHCPPPSGCDRARTRLGTATDRPHRPPSRCAHQSSFHQGLSACRIAHKCVSSAGQDT